MAPPDAETVLLRLKWGGLPPSGSGKPARNLTQEEARDLVVYYALNGVLQLEKEVTFGKDGKPSFPKIGEKVKLGLWIAGVHYQPDNEAASAWTATGPMDMRTAVLAVRLAQYLNGSRWGVDRIFWGGMGVGRDSNDRHGKGLAIDIHGAYGRMGWLDVSYDWGKQPITLPDGKKAKEWPATVQPYFRLDVDPPTGAGAFFYDLYKWLTGEAADGWGSKRTSIGDHSFILCPDMPDITYRPYHQDHIHCEIDR
jgi:hypothetical protein